MPRLVIFDRGTGELLRIVECPADMADVQASTSEVSFADETATAQTHYLNKGALTAYTPAQAASKATQPSYPSRWSDALLGWEDLRSVFRSRDAQWGRIKTLRNAALTAPLPTAYGEFDADPSSQKNITDSVLLAQTLAALGQPVEIDFTRADNTTVTLSAAQMIEVGLALGQRTQQVYATARALRAAIDAATTISEIESIAWPS